MKGAVKDGSRESAKQGFLFSLREGVWRKGPGGWYKDSVSLLRINQAVETPLRFKDDSCRSNRHTRREPLVEVVGESFDVLPMNQYKR